MIGGGSGGSAGMTKQFGAPSLCTSERSQRLRCKTSKRRNWCIKHAWNSIVIRHGLFNRVVGADECRQQVDVAVDRYLIDEDENTTAKIIWLKSRIRNTRLKWIMGRKIRLEIARAPPWMWRILPPTSVCSVYTI